MSKDKQEQHQPADLPATDFTGGWPHLGPPENYYANYFFASCDDKESAVLSELGWSLPEVQLSGPSHSDRLGDLVKEEERPGLAGSTENIAEEDTGVRSSDDAAFASRPCGDVPTSRSNPSASSDSSEEDRTEKPTGSSGQNLSAETPNKVQKRGQKRLKQPRFAFMTKSEVDNLEDGYRWRKYGQKAVKNSPFPRSYYRCTNSKCTVKKRVERSSNDPAVVITTYEGQHCHHTAGFLRGGVISNDLAAFGHHPARPFPQIYSSNATAAVRFPIGAPPNLKSYHVQTSSETERQQLGSFIRGTTSSAEHKPYFSLDH